MFPLYGIENEMSNWHRSNNNTDKIHMTWRDRKIAENVSRIKSDSIVTGNVESVKKTPMKSFNMQQRSSSSDSLLKSTGKKSPHHSRDKHASALTPKRCASNGGDRFIPSRSTSQITLGQYIMSQNGTEEDDVFLTPSKQYYQKVMNENLNGDMLNCNIIKYNQKIPEVNYLKSNMKVLYSSSKVPSSSSKSLRHIPQSPERILDAPDMLDDYYLNLLDWSSQNILAVCLGLTVYLWNATTGDIQALMELEAPEYISSVAWIANGDYLAVGTSTNEVQLWDVQRQKKSRTMRGHEARVGALSWNENVLSSGSKIGMLHHHDVRLAEHLIASWRAHDQEVCGLKWSPDGKYLASGGNDNILNIFDNHQGLNYTLGMPLYSFNEHTAAVKALAWCPWQPSLLASGGGTADQHIRFWNCNMGNMVNSVNTRSQVCSILWSKDYHELVSSHGFEHNQLIIWSYPKLEKITELTGHTSRVLHMGMSPDGSVVVSAAADETLRLWKCFAVDPKKKKEKTSKSLANTAALQYLR